MENPEDANKNQRVFMDRIKLHAFCIIAGFTGMRPTELLNLSWGDVGSRRMPRENGQSNDVTVLQARSKGRVRELVAMPEVLTHFNMLKNLFYVTTGAMPQDLDPVFFNNTGARIASFKKGLAELLEAADLRRHRDGRTRESFRFGFRHFYITQQPREGVGQHLLSRNEGTSAKMIDAYYSKVRPTDEARQLMPDWMRLRPLDVQKK